MNKNIKYSIIVCTKDRKDTLHKSINTLISNLGLLGKSTEILIVDQSQNNLTRKLIKKLKSKYKTFSIRYIRSNRVGISISRNIGIKNSSGKLIVFVDDDIVLPPNWLKVIDQITERYKNIDVFGGKILPSIDIESKHKYISYLRKDGCIWPYALCDLGNSVIKYPSDHPVFMVTAMMVVRRHIFDQFGIFNELFGNLESKIKIQGSEDTELIYRLTKNKVKMMYHPKIKSIHAIGEERLSKWYLRKRFFKNGMERANLNRIYLNRGKNKNEIHKIISNISFNTKKYLEEYLLNMEKNIVNELNVYYSLGYLWANFLFKIYKV